MDFAEVTEQFLALENDLDLLDSEIGGMPFWERIRFGLHRELLREFGLIGQGHSRANISDVRRLCDLTRNLFVKNPLLAPEADLLVWGHERRKRLEDGFWWDIYCDPVLELLDEDWVYLEQNHEGEHLTPARTERIRYLDWIQYASGIPNRLLRKVVTPASVVLSTAEQDILTCIEREVADRFGITVDLTERVASELLRRRVQLPIYRQLLDRVDPDLAVVVVSYVRETFVEACQREGVPVVELQHGVVSEHHLGYHYPNGSKRHFPDYFLAFGEFWSELVDFPLPDDRVLPVGYPYLEWRHEQFSDITPKRQVVFVSQGEPGEQLSQFATEFARLDHDWTVVYKLHPGEYSRWRSEYPWLEDAPLQVVDSSDPSLYKLFASSAAQVGAYSTALYEGLYFGLETFVVDVPGTSYMDQLVREEGAIRIETPAELVSYLYSASADSSIDLPRIFRPDASSNVVATLQTIRAEVSRQPRDQVNS